MKLKTVTKRSIDILMLLLLPVLMAEILTGQWLHEWIGTGMVVLFILHHILNFWLDDNCPYHICLPSTSV